MALEPLRSYAVRPIFSDMHDTGLFSWDQLYKPANEHAHKGCGHHPDFSFHRRCEP
ncbi:DUF971 domain-containing protein [Massilia sp. CCM 8733]|uniref:DUF971 domain-containing protein n=1 Tax=Massilia mucilaginosa TaxID=2609282 RepID=A0ABX0NNE2_9BURK|nr:gamma-butyrobetaine hydroxylase-like domain-containing protein [Massilia mucilaginosa]NHZ88307.1 DUF971 domain-containing protein [Massilia mucilaginosa]